MVLQFHDIEKIAEHPVPWPYTHLTQFFLVIWTYSLPLCLVPTYGLAGMEPVLSKICLPRCSLDMCFHARHCAMLLTMRVDGARTRAAMPTMTVIIVILFVIDIVICHVY